MDNRFPFWVDAAFCAICTTPLLLARDCTSIVHPYYGTASRFLASIREQGLKAGFRHFVHLSLDVETATAAARRHGKPVVLTVAAGKMHEQGHKFYQAENGVWLTPHVPSAFLSE